MTGREDTVAPGSLQGTHPRTKEHRFSVMRVQGYDQFARGDAKDCGTREKQGPADRLCLISKDPALLEMVQARSI